MFASVATTFSYNRYQIISLVSDTQLKGMKIFTPLATGIKPFWVLRDENFHPFGSRYSVRRDENFRPCGYFTTGIKSFWVFRAENFHPCRSRYSIQRLKNFAPVVTTFHCRDQTVLSVDLRDENFHPFGSRYSVQRDENVRPCEHNFFFSARIKPFWGVKIFIPLVAVNSVQRDVIFRPYGLRGENFRPFDLRCSVLKWWEISPWVKTKRWMKIFARVVTRLK